MTATLQFPNISPELFSFSLFGMEFALRWYALSYIVGIVLAWRLGIYALGQTRLWLDGTPPMSRTQLDDLLTWIIVGVILGGRLGFVLFYQPAYYLSHPSEILMIWNGGMSFHGGFLGVVIAVLIYALRQKIPLIAIADFISHAVPIPILFVRLANFINAELWGRATDLPWGMVFPGEAAQTCAGVVGVCARHPSQLYEAALEGLVLGLLLLWMVYRRGAFKSSGLVVGTFLAGYGVARFCVEFFRQPDAQFVSVRNPLGLAWHVNGVGLTMGQALSLPMIAAGLWLILRALRANRT
jgi:phosphatidylglycerol---prolipoprotein diacylglyceryl transferase